MSLRLAGRSPQLIAITLFSYVLARLLSHQWTTMAVLQLFCVILTAQMFISAFWMTVVYPHYFSPLCRLPQPDGGHWLLGHGVDVIKYGPGILASIL